MDIQGRIDRYIHRSHLNKEASERGFLCYIPTCYVDLQNAGHLIIPPNVEKISGLENNGLFFLMNPIHLRKNVGFEK